MTKELLITLLERKDKKRRRALWEVYQHLITTQASISFITQMINNELENNLVCDADVKYCRFYYMKKINVNRHIQSKKDSKKSPLPPTELISSVKNDSINWTDPDEINNPKTVKSKFSKE